jgi:hypothetical protein
MDLTNLPHLHRSMLLHHCHLARKAPRSLLLKCNLPLLVPSSTRVPLATPRSQRTPRPLERLNPWRQQRMIESLALSSLEGIAVTETNASSPMKYLKVLGMAALVQPPLLLRLRRATREQRRALRCRLLLQVPRHRLVLLEVGRPSRPLDSRRRRRPALLKAHSAPQWPPRRRPLLVLRHRPVLLVAA